MAFIGGHWIQLLRICKGLESTYDMAYASTHCKCAKMVEGQPFHKLIEFSRWNWYMMFPAFINDVKIVRKENPNIVIITGAAPRLIVLFVAFLLGKRTVWVRLCCVRHGNLCNSCLLKIDNFIVYLTLLDIAVIFMEKHICNFHQKIKEKDTFV